MNNEVKILGMTIEELRETLDYQPSLGTLTWKKDVPQGRFSGESALKNIDANGYYTISLNNKRILAHRLIYVLHLGVDLNGRMKFKDGNKQNFKWNNILKTEYQIDGEFSYTKREDILAYQKAYREQKPHMNKNSMLIKNYGINFEQYKEMLIEQDGKCAICKCGETATKNGKTISLAVDHCHSTGKVRSLLCGACNTAVGGFKDNIETMKNAISYIEKHNQPKKDSNVITLKGAK